MFSWRGAYALVVVFLVACVLGCTPDMPEGTVQTISRDLGRIIRETSLVEPSDVPLSRHLQAVEDRRTQCFEFYLRACVQRLAAPM